MKTLNRILAICMFMFIVTKSGNCQVVDYDYFNKHAYDFISTVNFDMFCDCDTADYRFKKDSLKMCILRKSILLYSIKNLWHIDSCGNLGYRNCIVEFLFEYRKLTDIKSENFRNLFGEPYEIELYGNNKIYRYFIYLENCKKECRDVSFYFNSNDNLSNVATLNYCGE